MKYLRYWFLLILTFLFLNPLEAYQSPEESFVIKNARAEAIASDKIPALMMSRLEILRKSDLARKKILSPEAFLKLKNDTLNNSSLDQSWIDEVNEALNGKKTRLRPGKKRFLSQVYRRYSHRFGQKNSQKGNVFFGTQKLVGS